MKPFDRHPRASRIRSPKVSSPPSCEPERWMVTPKRIQNELRTERMHKFLAQFNEQESRRALWLAPRATRKTALMRTVHG